MPATITAPETTFTADPDTALTILALGGQFTPDLFPHLTAGEPAHEFQWDCTCWDIEHDEDEAADGYCFCTDCGRDCFCYEDAETVRESMRAALAAWGTDREDVLGEAYWTSGNHFKATEDDGDTLTAWDLSELTDPMLDGHGWQGLPEGTSVEAWLFPTVAIIRSRSFYRTRTYALTLEPGTD